MNFNIQGSPKERGFLLLGEKENSKGVSHLSKIETSSNENVLYSKNLSLTNIVGPNRIYAYNSYFPANLMPILTRVLRKKLIYAPQAGGFHKLQSNRKNWLFRQILKLGSFEALRCISMWEYDRYQELGIPEDKLFYCPLGVDYDSFSDIRPSMDSRRVFSLANARRFKDVETQIRAVESLVQDGCEVHLNIIGGWADEGYREEIEDLVRDLEVQDNVTIHGFVSRKRMFEIMSNCEAFIHTSKFETQGLAIYEAAAAGFPICVSDVPVHNQNFKRFKHPQGDYQSLAEDIKQIFEMGEDEKREVSDEMRDLAKDFSYEKEMERLNEFFDELDNHE